MFVFDISALKIELCVVSTLTKIFKISGGCLLFNSRMPKLFNKCIENYRRSVKNWML